jgi:glycosyltransferase involved in cell wall biosynthesis
VGARPRRTRREGACVPLLLWNQALIASIIVAVVWTALFLRSLRGLSATPRLLPGGTSRARAIAFVPARNEAEVIERSIDALLRQGEALEAIVAIDDASTDRTGEILSRIAVGAEGRLIVRTGTGPKAGECGKPAALAEAVEEEASAAEWLLFVDADVVLEPGAVTALLAAAEKEQVDLVSIVPRVEMKSALEHLMMPAVGALVLAQYPPERVRDPKRKDAFANGQLILVRRASYHAAGGHRAVVREILEDVRLAEAVKKAGGRLLVADGGAIASTHMYASFSEIVEGWSKNLYLLLGSSALRSFFWAAAAIVLSWIGPVLAVVDFPYGIGAWALILVYQIVLRRKGGAPGLWAIFAPIASLLSAWLIVRSTRLHTTNRAIHWKGRAYRPR